MSREAPTHVEIYALVSAMQERLNTGSDRFVEINKKLDEIVKALEPLPQMQRDIAATKDIVEAWSAIKTIGKFIKWTGGIIAAIAVIVGSIFTALKIAVQFGD